ncbi:hypothetical protein PF1934 [Pyrococcus furiosus DSM 3638]|uniref:Glucodextranase-like C-terminal domain-containing protein n=1 Tax=Pyrococcus furiosus (strain ATCC 43587 / DSM 3638 / JCM 8422 / Vc1) TaxID=186497 RepID=Q8TZQ2_PYRFU|nr:hypothetical protein PF1934 [Pyrococcus furiosus DSM 3638]
MEAWRGRSQAVVDNLAPRVVDMLVPEGFKPTQEEQLSSYDVEKKELATVYMITLVSGSGEKEEEVEEETPTQTETQTPTETRTETKTPTETTTTTPTETKETPTQTTTTQPARTETQGGICGPGLIVLLAALGVLRRRS